LRQAIESAAEANADADQVRTSLDKVLLMSAVAQKVSLIEDEDAPSSLQFEPATMERLRTRACYLPSTCDSLLLGSIRIELRTREHAHAAAHATHQEHPSADEHSWLTDHSIHVEHPAFGSHGSGSHHEPGHKN
jgi:hypothetical protein